MLPFDIQRPGDKRMFTIGEFSRVTGLTVKALRFYHEEGLLVPVHVDPQSGYRYYADDQIELARTIAFLRSLEFPLAEIKSLLQNRGENEKLLDLIQRQRSALAERAKQYRQLVRRLDRFIAEQREFTDMAQSAFEIQEKSLDSLTIAGIRMKGRYADCGAAFGRIARAFGRYLAGSPFLLHFDAEYKEDDADFEACFPIRRSKQVEGISTRELPAGRCAALLHKGPYDQLGRSYEKILKHVGGRQYKIVMPTREVYIKGPGMIFKGNPRSYLTEIQIPIEEA